VPPHDLGRLVSRRRTFAAGVFLALAVLASGCGAGPDRRDGPVRVAGVELIPASAGVRPQCERAASELGLRGPLPDRTAERIVFDTSAD
jgi:hypothetical protein